MKEYSKYVNLLIQAQLLNYNDSIEEIIYENLTKINVKFYLKRILIEDFFEPDNESKLLSEDRVEIFGEKIKEIFRCNDEFYGKLEDPDNKEWAFKAFLYCFALESYKDISDEFFEIYKDFVIDLPDYVEEYYQERVKDANRV